ncbi:MAG: hypothetical protein ACREBW_02860 [Candidatus Micrarchaeaceae archaeon]
MRDELNEAINSYRQKWQDYAARRQDKAFFAAQMPTAVAWKVADAEELHRRFVEFREECDQIHFGWVNERWLVTMHLKNTPLAWNISVVKLMQRRPGSTDAIGLDHIDFYSLENAAASKVLTVEPDLQWNEERNGDYCKWMSVWFEGTEAKLRTDTVFSPCIAEMQAIEDTLLGSTA